MAKIVGNAVGIPNPQSDWNQSDATKADFIKNKPTVLTEDDVLALIGGQGGSGGDGVGIADIYSTADDTGRQMVVIITLTDGRQLSFGVPYGKDGETPKKGIDYWTDADKAEIKSYVDDEIGNYETAISEIIELQKQFINEITFNLNGTNYTCPKGMTWAELETYDGGAIWQTENLGRTENPPISLTSNGVEVTTIDSVAYVTRNTYISDIIRDVSENIVYY